MQKSDGCPANEMVENLVKTSDSAISIENVPLKIEKGNDSISIENIPMDTEKSNDAISIEGVPMVIEESNDANFNEGVPMVIEESNDAKSIEGVPMVIEESNDADLIEGVPMVIEKSNDAISIENVPMLKEESNDAHLIEGVPMDVELKQSSTAEITVLEIVDKTVQMNLEADTCGDYGDFYLEEGVSFEDTPDMNYAENDFKQDLSSQNDGLYRPWLNTLSKETIAVQDFSKTFTVFELPKDIDVASLSDTTSKLNLNENAALDFMQVGLDSDHMKCKETASAESVNTIPMFSNQSAVPTEKVSDIPNMAESSSPTQNDLKSSVPCDVKVSTRGMNEKLVPAEVESSCNQGNINDVSVVKRDRFVFSVDAPEFVYEEKCASPSIVDETAILEPKKFHYHEKFASSPVDSTMGESSAADNMNTKTNESTDQYGPSSRADEQSQRNHRVTPR